MPPGCQSDGLGSARSPWMGRYAAMNSAFGDPGGGVGARVARHDVDGDGRRSVRPVARVAGVVDVERVVTGLKGRQGLGRQGDRCVTGAVDGRRREHDRIFASGQGVAVEGDRDGARRHRQMPLHPPHLR